jgi:hypothetical protein
MIAQAEIARHRKARLIGQTHNPQCPFEVADGSLKEAAQESGRDGTSLIQIQYCYNAEKRLYSTRGSLYPQISGQKKVYVFRTNYQHHLDWHKPGMRN